ncbi:CsbD family protein [Actinomyces provencensis]|uniref:CsbD family protein n=1 Tax=Actinomyces provencensis TaxID=1720198 RepID=UPI00096AC07E|nr:CsbD family protein [Actinomyces provencensis]
MSDFDDKLDNKADQAGGKLKETAGKVTGDKDLEAEGKIQNAEGKVKETLDDAGDKVRDAAGDVKAGAEALVDRAKKALHRDVD